MKKYKAVYKRIVTYTIDFTSNTDDERSHAYDLIDLTDFNDAVDNIEDDNVELVEVINVKL